MQMDERRLLFFEKNMDALPLYEKLEQRILSEIGEVCIKVQKTQISFSNKYMFSCVSFARVRKKKECPSSYIVVTFGLGHKVESPRIDVSTEPLQSYYTGLTFRGYVDGVSQYIVSGGRYDGLLSGFDGTPMPSVGMAFNIDVLTDVLMQSESNIQDNGKLRIALTKGRVEKDFIPLLEFCGIDCEPLRNKARKLIIPLGDSVEVILAKGPDVTTYLNNGVVDLGIVGSDVLDEQDNTSYEMLDLKTGQCQFILASLEGYNPKEGRRQRIGTKYPTITKQYFGSQDVEIIKIEGSVELAPLVGLADAIVDITETGTTLRENNLKIYDWLQPISTRLVANPLALKQKRNTIFALIDQLQAAIDKK